MKIALTVLAAVAVAAAAQDTPRNHVEAMTGSQHEFKLRMGGTVDGENSRDPIVYNAWKTRFEPMRYVRLENVGDRDIVNPWVSVNGKRNWRTAKDIADEAVRSYGDPKQLTDAEKVRAIWDFQRQHRFHATTGDMEVRDPVKMFNVYGYSLCGDNAPVLSDLWRTQGFQTRRGFPLGHCVSEVWYGGGWHMLDADESVIFLDRDNQTVVPEKQVAHDHDLARRGYRNEMLGTLYTYDAAHGGDFPSHADHTMAFTLRPGESIEWRWDNVGKHHRGPLPSLYTFTTTELKRWGDQAWATLANGKWSYTPRLSSAAGPQTWKMEMPYVIVGGRLRARVRAGAKSTFRISFDNSNWTPVQSDLDQFFPSVGTAVYRYYLQADNPAALESLTIENDLQMARLSLPALELGENRISYTDQTSGPRAVRLSFDWMERSGITPPPAPAAPEYPADRASVEGTNLTLRWPGVPEHAEYHFQLGDDPKLRSALTPAFDEVVSTARFEIKRPGLLNPGQTYYWHVRARTSEGVWGPWSKTWSFVPQAPGVPLKVRLEQSAPAEYTLRWDANQRGRKPALFKIYASDEKGFSVSDEPYRVPTGNQKVRGLFPGEGSKTFPANLLATTKDTSFKLPPTHAFYRVVAVDEKGNRSDSSDYATAPRPFIYSRPATTGKVGELFRYGAKTIASIGDLTYRDFGPGQAYQSAYWDADQPTYSLEYEMPRCGNFDPKWLRIEPKTGILTGTPGPADAGEYQVNIKVEIPGAGVYVQSFPLRIATR